MCERYITVILHCIYYIRIQTWFNANEMVILIPQEHTSEEPQVINLDNICMMDGSCISTTQFSGCGWIWKDNFGKIQLMGIRNLIRRDIGFNSEVGALRWEMESILQYSSCQSFMTDCKDLVIVKDPQAWPTFATELKAIKTLQICFPDFKISHIPRVQNGILDSLAKTARSFHRKLCYIGCSIPVLLPRPPRI